MRYGTSVADAECAKILIDAVANVNAIGSGGVTPLHFASLQGHVEVVRVTAGPTLTPF